MKIYVTKDAKIAGSDWKADTLLEAPDRDAKAAIAEGTALPLEKAAKQLAARAKAKAAAKKK